MSDIRSLLSARGFRIYAGFMFIVALAIVFFLNAQPGYTDAFYHYNAAVQLVEGNGLVDHYLWTYIGAPDTLPAPSHLYWMPGTSLVAAAGMFIFGTNYIAAQIGLFLCLWGAAIATCFLSWYLGGGPRHAWQAGLIVLFGGFFMRFWGQTDTFAPYLFFGSLALAFTGIGMIAEKNNVRWWAIAGAFAAAGHLIRSDGLLLLLVGWATLFWPFDWFNRTFSLRKRSLWFIVFTAAYLIVISPWFIRNQSVIGTVLPVGGAQGAWYTEYDDLFNYPPDASPETLFADGWDLFVESRLWALFSTDGVIVNFIAVESSVILAPFILIGLWERRKDVFLRPIWLFALGIHLAFALVFPFPGTRGGLFHAAAALMPFWAVLGILGLDTAIEWAATKRRQWNAGTAKPIFSTGFMLIIIVLSLQIAIPARHSKQDPEIYRVLQEILPPDARVMLNDPAQYYYYTGRSAFTIPNESPGVALEIAERYDIDYLVLEENGITDQMKFTEAPDFLRPIEVQLEGVWVYAFDRG